MKLTRTITLLNLIVVVALAISLDPSNRCHFNLNGKLYVLKTLQTFPYYQKQIDDDTTVLFNFCQPFDPPEGYTCQGAYSMVLNSKAKTCERFSSDSLLYQYTYEEHQGKDEDDYGVTLIEDSGVAGQDGNNKTTRFVLECSTDETLKVDDVYLDGSTLWIQGESKYGCPFLEINKLWSALQDNAIIIGMLMLAAGFMQLFFGRSMLRPTIFVCSYLLAFAVLGSFTSELFLSPNSSMLAIYFVLLLVIFASSIVAYYAMSIDKISIFFIGAGNFSKVMNYFLVTFQSTIETGLIVAMLLNSVFIKISGVHTVWSLVILSILFGVGFGLLTFKISDEIIILSTALTGSYLILRPISWALGGFPNELLLAQSIKAKSLNQLPGTFFIYFTFILALAAVGAIYQFLQLKRERFANQTLEVGLVEQKIEASVDMVRNSVNSLINKYRVSPELEHEGIEFDQLKNINTKRYSNDMQHQQMEEMGVVSKNRKSGPTEALIDQNRTSKQR